MSDIHPIEASALHARRERVFLVLAGLFLGSMTMLASRVERASSTSRSSSVT